MSGKTILFVVMGFSLIFLISSFKYTNLSNRSIDNNVSYYNNVVAKNIARAGMNLALNALIMDNKFGGFTDLSFEGGTINVSVNPTGQPNQYLIVCDARYCSTTKQIKALTQPGSFAEYANFSDQFPGNLTFFTGDTIFGRYHTNQTLRVSGTPGPCFLGPASAKLGTNIDLTKLTEKEYSDIFHHGFTKGQEIKMEWDSEKLKKNAKIISDSKSNKIGVKIKFNDNGTMTFSTRKNDLGIWGKDTTVVLSTYSPSGVIYINKGNAYIEGTVSGRVTLIVDQSSGSGSGNVYIENDVLYKNDPRTNSASTDALGIVCSNNVIVRDNSANQDDVNIFASIYSYQGGLTIENTKPSFYYGYMNVYGGLIEQKAQITGTISRSGLYGYNQKIYYDERMRLFPPTNFPKKPGLIIASWIEK